MTHVTIALPNDVAEVLDNYYPSLTIDQTASALVTLFAVGVQDGQSKLTEAALALEWAAITADLANPSKALPTHPSNQDE